MSEPTFEERQRNFIRADQEYFDKHLQKIGERARAPVLGETRLEYNREQLRAIKRRHLTNHEFYRLNMRGLSGEVIETLRPQILQAAEQEYWNPKNVPKGTIEARHRFDNFGRLQATEFLGQECFVKTWPGARSGRRVASFWPPQP
jgi:hypothetical protein